MPIDPNQVQWDSAPDSDFISPINGVMSSSFNDMRDGGNRVHRSGDIAAPVGTEFVAPRPLKITHVRDKMSDSPGGMVWAVDDQGKEHRFIHVVPGVKPGDIVNPGQTLGVLSSIKGPHLHYQMRDQNGNPIDWTKNFKRGDKFQSLQTSNMVAGPATPKGKRDVSLEKAAALGDIKWDDDKIDISAVQWDNQEVPGLMSKIGQKLSSVGQVINQNTDMGALADPNLVGAAGEMVGKAIDIPFVPLRMALEQVHRNIVEPVIQRDITSQAGSDIPAPGLGAPEAFAPLAGEKAFVPTMELAMAPAYLRFLTKAGDVLAKTGKVAFYKHAPDAFFRKGEAGLPEVISQERIAELLNNMSGSEKAAMARKYPQFRKVLDELTTGAREVNAPAMPSEVGSAGPGVIGRTEIAGELVEPQAKLPPGQGFALKEKVVRRPGPTEEYPGDYLAGGEAGPIPTEKIIGGRRVVQPVRDGVVKADDIPLRGSEPPPDGILDINPAVKQIPTKGEYIIKLLNGEEETRKGIIVGDIGIKKEGKYYTLDHIPTGGMIKLGSSRTYLDGYFDKQKEAIEVAKIINESGIDLNKLPKSSSEERKEISSNIRNIFENIGNPIAETVPEPVQSLPVEPVPSDFLRKLTEKNNDNQRMLNNRWNQLHKQVTGKSPGSPGTTDADIANTDKAAANDSIYQGLKNKYESQKEYGKKYQDQNEEFIKQTDKDKQSLDDLIEKYKATGRTATRYPRKKQVSVDGRMMTEQDAVAKMQRVVAAQQAPDAAFRAKYGTAKREDVQEVIGKNSDTIKNYYAGAPIPIADLLKKAKGIAGQHLVKIKDKDINLLAQYGDLPYWRAQEIPEGGKVFQVQADRQAERAIAYDTMLGEMDNTIKFVKQLKRDNPQRFDLVNKAAFHFDKIRVEPTNEDLAKFGLKPEEVKAYRKAREMLEWVRDDYFYLLQDLGAPTNEIDELRRRFGKIPGYIPHKRKGKYFVRATMPKEGGKPEVVYREHFDDIIATITGYSHKGKQRLSQLAKDYPEASLEAGKIKEIPEDYFWKVDTDNMQALIDAAVAKVDVPGGEEQFKKALQEAMAKTLMARGFGRHFIERKDIAGYDQSDFLAATIEHLQGYYGFKTKMRAAYNFRKALSQLPPESGERLYWDKYVRDMLANATQWDRTVDKVRAGFFLYFLAGVPRQLLLQPTQNFISGVPNLQIYSKWSSAKILSEMVKTSGDIATLRKVRPHGMPVDNGVAIAKKKGIIDPQLTREYEGYLAGMFGKAGKQLSKLAGIFIGNAEVFNRETMYRTAYKIATEELKQDHLAAMQFAEKMVNDTHYVYGKGNLPPLMRGGDLEKALRTGYTFRSFNANFIRQMWHLGKTQGAKGGEGILKALGFLTLLGGVSAIPFFKDIERYYQKKTGKNLRGEVKKAFPDYADYINYGLPSMIGVDLSGSMGIESIKDWKELIGVPYEMVRIPSSVMEDINKKDYYRAIEDAAPSVIKSPMSAYRMATEGMTTRGGEKITDAQGKPVKLSTREAITKGLTFRTTKQAEMQRQYEAQKTSKEQYDTKRTNIIKSFKINKERHGTGSEELKDIMKDVRDFNKELSEKRIKFIAPITKDTLKGKKESKREHELKKAFD